MKFLAAGMENQIAIDVKVRNEYAVPTSNLLGVLSLSGSNTPITIPKAEATTYFVTVPAVSPARGSYAPVKLQLNAQTGIGLFRHLSTYLVFDYADILTDYDGVRVKLGVTPEELNDEELSLETSYLNLFGLFTDNFHTLRDINLDLNLKFSQLVAVQAALLVAPYLPVRLSKKDATENGEFTRLGNASDIANLMAALDEERYGLLKSLSDYLLSPETVVVGPMLEFLAISPDRITGA